MEFTDDEARALLKADFEVLVQADAFKQDFDKYVMDHWHPIGSKQSMPREFWLRCVSRSSISDAQAMIRVLLQPPKFDFGKLNEKSSEPRAHLPCGYFIASPLLPVGKPQKFTGSNILGAPEDDLAMAIHAFTHYVWIMSRDYLMLCDLQGLAHD